MAKSKQRDLALVIGMAVPLVAMVLPAGSIYLPRVLAEIEDPKYDFLYTVGYSQVHRYVVENECLVRQEIEFDSNSVVKPSEAEMARAWRDGDGGVDVERRATYSRILYFVGGGVVVMGIVALIAQVWDDLGSAMRIAVTFGSGGLAFITGALFSRRQIFGAAGAAFFLIAALVLPAGMAVTLHEVGLDPEDLGWQSVIALALAAAFLSAYLGFRSNSLLLWTIGYLTWGFFVLTEWLFWPANLLGRMEFLEYRTLAVGVAYLLLAFGFSGTTREELSGVLYAFGSMAFLGAALSLGGWTPDQNVFWELAFPGLVFGMLYASVHLKSRALLTSASVFLVAYLGKITGEYFSDSMGWPLALVIFGMMLMGVGYLTLRLKRAYLSA